MAAKNNGLFDGYLQAFPSASFSKGVSGEAYVPVGEDDFDKAISFMDERGCFLVSLFCAENFGVRGLTLFYVFIKKGCPDILVLKRAAPRGQATSIAKIFPSASWYEREVSDGFGVEFEGAFDKRRLFLHDTYPGGFHPLLKSFKNGKVRVKSRVLPSEEYKFKEVSGEGVYQIPVGPVHAGIIEPGHFRFSVIGETIFNLEIRMFYKHRGIEKLAEGKTPHECVAVAESISGDESAANAAAFCTAIEKISGATITDRALRIRTVLLELERIYSHLGDMAGMIIDVAYPVGASPFFMLREEIFRQNEALSGSRFLKGIIVPGGLKKDVPDTALEALENYLEGFRKMFSKAVSDVHASPSVIDRLEGTGIIAKELVRPLNITGPAARASGAYFDTRLEYPYGAYAEFLPKIKVLDNGDVMSRFEVKAAEVLDSADIVRNIILGMPRGEVYAAPKISDGYALSLVEAPRGQSFHWVSVRQGKIDRYKIRTPSFCNWSAIEHAVLGNIVPDFPLINKSLNLSYAGTDL